MARIYLRALGVSAVLVAAAVAGCSGSGGEHAVFTVVTGRSTAATARTTDLVDLGVPDLYNQGDQAVRLRGVSLVGAPGSVHLRWVTAYLHSQTGIGQIGWCASSWAMSLLRRPVAAAG